MIRVPDRALPDDAAATLGSWQAELDAITDFDAKVTTAHDRFRSRSSSRTLRVVRETLTDMCSGLVRCNYCEDSAGNEIEHTRPKVHYPDLTFVWHNFLFSCSPCNRRKNARFAVLRGAELVELPPARGRPRVPPPPGSAAIIDPRCEDPLELLEIDLTDTYLVKPRSHTDARARQRAQYTIELLGLNKRATLVESRRLACRNYAFRTAEYAALDPDAPPARRQQLLAELGRLHHRMVWEEMKRSPSAVVGLREHFAAAPELLEV